MVTVKNNSKSFDDHLVLDKISFAIEKGQTLSIIGASGSGKTTLLRTLNRLHEVSDGTILFNRKDIKSFSPTDLRRKIGYVLQKPALLPHWTVRDNIATVPKLLKWKKGKTDQRCRKLLETMGMDPDRYLSRYPSELSGGQQQRIGIARALAAQPELILYDEPFSALDPITRSDLQEEVQRLKRKTATTSIFVTHDMREAFKLGDRIIILHNGKIAQEGTPEEIQENPASDYIKRFIETTHV